MGKRIFKTVILAVGLTSLLAACQMFEAPSEAEFEFMDITTLALQDSTIDFEGLSEGLIVSSVSHGNGISGHDTGGSVGVFGVNPNFGAETNAAIIFDATCEPGGAPANCTGEDDDLFAPTLGNILIIAEDLVDDAPADGLVDDPDDADVKGETFRFNFSDWTTSNTVTIGTMVMNVIDVEAAQDEVAGAEVKLYSGNDFTGLLETIDIDNTGDGVTGSVTQPMNVAGVGSMTVNLQGSGGIDNIRISTDTPAMGCTPGFWRNWDGNGPQPNAWASTGYSPDQQFSSLFDDAFSGKTLGQVVELGGGGLNALGRHTVAALLNAAHPNVVYGISDPNDVIDAFNDVYPGTKSDYNHLKDQFEGFNEAGCPLSRNLY